MKKGFVSLMCALGVMCCVVQANAQDGIWKNDPTRPNDNFYVQTYDNDPQPRSAVVIFSTDATDIAAFLASDFQDEVDVDDIGSQGHHLKMTFQDADNATATLTLNGQAARNYTLTRAFVSNKGEKGDPGPQGPPGPVGDPGAIAGVRIDRDDATDAPYVADWFNYMNGVPPTISGSDGDYVIDMGFDVSFYFVACTVDSNWVDNRVAICTAGTEHYLETSEIIYVTTWCADTASFCPAAFYILIY